jgi:DNA processing protein
MSKNGYYWYQLYCAKGVGPKMIHKLYSLLESHSVDVSSLFGAERANLAKKLRVDSKITQALEELDVEKTHADYDALQQQEIKVIHLGHPDYPEKLIQRLGDSAPPVLFCSGQVALLSAKSVAMVGSRNVSDEGMKFAKTLAGQLAQAGYNVISGYAKGVDTLAHAAALEKEGTTTIVLSYGILEFNLKREFQDLPRRGSIAVVSQFPPRQPWMASSAMQRNKLVVGLADALVVVESGAERDEKGRMSGTFDAAKNAIKYNVPLFVLSPRSLKPGGIGNEALIRLGGVEIEQTAAVKTIASQLKSVVHPPETTQADLFVTSRVDEPKAKYRTTRRRNSPQHR